MSDLENLNSKCSNRECLEKRVRFRELETHCMQAWSQLEELIIEHRKLQDEHNKTEDVVRSQAREINQQEAHLQLCNDELYFAEARYEQLRLKLERNNDMYEERLHNLNGQIEELTSINEQLQLNSEDQKKSVKRELNSLVRKIEELESENEQYLRENKASSRLFDLETMSPKSTSRGGASSIAIVSPVEVESELGSDFPNACVSEKENGGLTLEEELALVLAQDSGMDSSSDSLEQALDNPKLPLNMNNETVQSSLHRNTPNWGLVAFKSLRGDESTSAEIQVTPEILHNPTANVSGRMDLLCSKRGEEVPVEFHSSKESDPKSQQAIDPNQNGQKWGKPRKDEQIENHKEKLKNHHRIYTRLSCLCNVGREELINVIAIVVYPTKKHLKYQAKLCLSDGSEEQYPPTKASIWRPNHEVLPKANTGDCILLRNFAVDNGNHGNMRLVSRNTSAWCVWKGGNEYICAGPQVEISKEEAQEMERLHEWWQLQSP